jgi:hypothetical protein
MRDERTTTNLIKKKRAPVRGNAAGFAGRRGIDTRLEIPAGEPDLARLHAVTQEWLVPLLVDEFLRERGVAQAGANDGEPENRTIECTY